MKNPEKGAGWEIVREYTEPELAIKAGIQVLDLIESDSKYIREYGNYNRPGQENLKSFRFFAWHPGTFPNHPNTIQADPLESANARELIDLHRRSSKVVSRKVNAAQINVFEEQGHTWRHRDRFVGESLVVSLLGLGLVQIKDPVFGTKHSYELIPGDALKLNNPRKQSERPLHKVSNIGKGKRVTLIE